MGLAFCTEGDGIEGDECMVPDDVDTVAVAEEGIESFANGEFYTVAEAEVVVSGQVSHDSVVMDGVRGFVLTSLCPFVEEDVAEAFVFLDPVVFAIVPPPRV